MMSELPFEVVPWQSKQTVAHNIIAKRKKTACSVQITVILYDALYDHKQGLSLPGTPYQK